jgi:twitching motility protein PilT
MDHRNFWLDRAFFCTDKKHMDLQTLVGLARSHGASDLHLEPGLPAAVRIRGTLTTVGEPIPAAELLELARTVIGHDQWPRFLERRSYDLSRTVNGVRCRINVLTTSRGVGFAIRLLAAFTATIDKLNLHPDLKKIATTQPHGLVLLSGPTGCGKSSTMAALIQEINSTDTRHIITIESPIEYTFRPKLSYIRQREVERDTPSFERAIIDSLREDPDVLMVGEMREPETMRLTLNASETGHLVLATVHSSTCVEALQRVANAFPSELQHAVRSQLADCVLAVVCQRLRYRSDLKIRVPELEILTPTYAVKNFIRTGDFFKIAQVMETGAEQGMWTWQRYQTWMEKKRDWHVPESSEQADSEANETPALPAGSLPPVPLRSASASTTGAGAGHSPSAPAAAKPGGTGRIEIEPIEGGLHELIKKLGENS